MACDCGMNCEKCEECGVADCDCDCVFIELEGDDSGDKIEEYKNW